MAAAAFAKKWEGRGYEKGDSQPFWLTLLRQVYGVENPAQFISFEDLNIPTLRSRVSGV